MILIIVPLCIPVIIFGAGAVTDVEAGMSPRGHHSLLALLGALFTFMALPTPIATAALRIATE
ncbi:MAG: hypothetical protein ABI699_02885 [Caldimonas sp.]